MISSRARLGLAFAVAMQAGLLAAGGLSAAGRSAGGLFEEPELWWGLHAWALLPPLPLAGLVVAALAAGVAVHAPFRFPGRPRAAVLAGLAAFPVFLLLRDATHLLGDGRLWISVAEHKPVYHSHEPLAFALAWTAGTFVPVGSVTFRLEVWSAVLGAVGVILSVLLAARVAAGPRGRWFALVLLCGAGTIQFAFGYIEAYPALWVSVLFYMWCAVRVVEKGTGWGRLGAALGMAVAVHGSAILLVPSAVLVLWSVRPGFRTVMGALGMMAVPVGVAYIGLPQIMPSVAGETAGVGNVVSGSWQILGGLELYGHGALAWILDQVNRWSLVAPMSVMLVVLGPVAGGRSTGRNLVAVTGVAAAAMMLPALVLDTEASRGSAVDWDTFATAGVPLALTAALLWAGEVDAARKLRLPAAFVAGVVTVTGLGFVLVNASDRLAPRRLELLASTDTWSVETRARAYESLALYYRSRADTTRAVEMYLRAGDRTGNRRLLRNAAILLSRIGRHREAADVFTRLAAAETAGAAAEAWARVARERELAGEVGPAEAAWRRALSLDGTAVESMNRLARLLLATRDDREGMAEAYSLIRRSLSLAPGQPGAGEMERTLEALESRGIGTQ